MVPVTLTENVQVIPGDKLPPIRLTEEELAGAEIARRRTPPVSPLGVATSKPGGRLSLNATPVRGNEFVDGLVTTNVSEVAPFNGIVSAPNVLLICGGLATVRFADARLPVPPLVEVTAAVVLV